MSAKTTALAVANQYLDDHWRQVDEFEKYFVSDTGEIFSTITRKVLVTPIDRVGYKRILLRLNGTQYNVAIHRLVALAFCSGYFTGAQVNHMDGNKLNNAAWNLEWVTASENTSHGYRLGLNSGASKKESIGRRDWFSL